MTIIIRRRRPFFSVPNLPFKRRTGSTALGRFSIPAGVDGIRTSPSICPVPPTQLSDKNTHFFGHPPDVRDCHDDVGRVEKEGIMTGTFNRSKSLFEPHWPLRNVDRASVYGSPFEGTGSKSAHP
jgi:hypothetical protein